MTDTPSAIAREMTRKGYLLSWISARWTMFRRRWLPYLVWYGSELDVLFTFKENKLPDIDYESNEEGFEKALALLSSGHLAKIEDDLGEIGITFDKGVCCDGRDWAWDWSLHGPISVTFLGPASKPERRQ